MSQKSKSPIMKLMGNLHYYHKFAIISILFGLAILVSIYFIASTRMESIRTTKLELAGIHYQREIEKVLEGIIKHRSLVEQFLSGDQSLRAEIVTLEAQINAQFRELNEIDESLQNILQTTVGGFQFHDYPNLKPQELERKWITLQRDVFDLTAVESNNLHLRLIDDILNLVFYTVDTAGLGLDSNPETYYLIITTMQLIPEAQRLVPQINVSALESVKSTELISQVSVLKANLDETRTTVEKSYIFGISREELEDSKTQLLDPLRKYLDAGDNYATLIYKQPENTAEIIALSKKFINESFALWNTNADYLEYLLKNRLWSQQLHLYIPIATVLLLTILAFLFGVHVLGEAMRPIYNLMEATKELASGNLSVRVPVVFNDTLGELSRSINKVAESFQELIGQLQWTGIQLTTSTTQIAAAAKQQETTVIQQEATTKEIAVTAREISATAKDFAKTMSEVSKTAEQTSAIAASGKNALTQMQSIMHQLVDASTTIGTKLGALNEKAGTITGVVTTITKVADQTNLLSLNAAIEAEKAGEHGRSFAVIAREIRRLADQTANATYDIEKMVTEMVSAVSAGVMGVDKFSAEIHNAVAQVNTVSEHLTQIIEQVQQQTASFESVNQGMQAQSLGAEQINESIIQLSEVAQQTADSIRQFHRAIEQLNNAAQEMQNSVVKIKR